MKAKVLKPQPMAAAVAHALGGRVWPLIGVLVEDRERHLVDEVRRDIESQRIYVQGVATMAQWYEGMRKMREAEYTVQITAA
jgi:hypothetical protein